MSRIALFALLSTLPGCYLSHGLEVVGRDASIDARRLDAPGDTPRPPGAYWTLEPRGARLSIPHELGCTQYEGGRIAIDVVIPTESTCVHQGPVGFEATPDGGVVVRAQVWLEHRDDCRPEARILETTLLVPAHEGTMRAVDALSGSSVEYRVTAIDDLPCTRAGGPGSPCIMDCECDGDLVCIPEVGDFVECRGGTCGHPCVPGATGEPVYALHLDCAPSEECVPGGAAASCRPLAVGCAPSTCGPGLFCPDAEPSQCLWEIELRESVRHPCGSDADCDPGLYCVEASGLRTCEVPCATDHMRCPPMHECRPDRWVCEWIGE